MLEIAGAILLAYLIMALIAVFIRPILWALGACAFIGFIVAWVFFAHWLFR